MARMSTGSCTLLIVLLIVLSLCHVTFGFRPFSLIRLPRLRVKNVWWLGKAKSSVATLPATNEAQETRPIPSKMKNYNHSPGINALINAKLLSLEETARAKNVQEYLSHLRGLNFGVRGFSLLDIRLRLLSSLEIIADSVKNSDEIAGILRNMAPFLFIDPRSRCHPAILRLMNKYFQCESKSSQSVILVISAMKALLVQHRRDYDSHFKPLVLGLINEQFPSFPSQDLSHLSEFILVVSMLKIRWYELAPQTQTALLGQLQGGDVLKRSDHPRFDLCMEKILENLGEMRMDWENDLPAHLRQQFLEYLEQSVPLLSFQSLLNIFSG